MDAEIEKLNNPKYVPCGGCGAEHPRERCINCRHDFSGHTQGIDPYAKEPNPLIVTRGDGVPLPDQAAAVEAFKDQARRARETLHDPEANVTMPGGTEFDGLDLIEARATKKGEAPRRVYIDRSSGKVIEDASNRRIQDLLEANNRYLERARDAEAKLKDMTFERDALSSIVASGIDDVAGASLDETEEQLRLANERMAIMAGIARAREERFAKYRFAAMGIEDWWLSKGMQSLNGAPAAIFKIRSLLSEDPDKPRRVRHKKRGSTYRVIGEAEAQVATKGEGMIDGARVLYEGDKVTFYRSDEDGKLWARFSDEFEDGRFEDI